MSKYQNQAVQYQFGLNNVNVGIDVRTGLCKRSLEEIAKRGAFKNELFTTNKDDKVGRKTLNVEFCNCTGLLPCRLHVIWMEITYPHVILFGIQGPRFQPILMQSCKNPYLARWWPRNTAWVPLTACNLYLRAHSDISKALISKTLIISLNICIQS